MYAHTKTGRVTLRGQGAGSCPGKHKKDGWVGPGISIFVTLNQYF